MKHTQREWLIESSGLTEMSYDIQTNDNSTLIARVGTKDDAKLIAAAPNNLKANQESLAVNKMLVAINRVFGIDSSKRRILRMEKAEWDLLIQVMKNQKEAIQKAIG